MILSLNCWFMNYVNVIKIFVYLTYLYIFQFSLLIFPYSVFIEALLVLGYLYFVNSFLPYILLMLCWYIYRNWIMLNAETLSNGFACLCTNIWISKILFDYNIPVNCLWYRLLWWLTTLPMIIKLQINIILLRVDIIYLAWRGKSMPS